jgi:hypothetical protein
MFWLAGASAVAALLLVSGNAGAVELLAVFLFFEEVRYVKECIALQADVDECRLHSGKHASDTTFVNGSGESVFILALVVDFGELVIFENRQPRFMRRSGNANFL